MGVPVRDRGPEMLGTVGLFLALSTITVLLRTYCRVFLVKNFGLDDCFAVIAWVLFLLYCAFAILGVYNGTGQHSWNLPPEILPVGLKVRAPFPAVSFMDDSDSSSLDQAN